ncbi:uncharacterized protein CCOS01_01861 [Colletotrichum costaricense]|uniref:Uncharacterized protein n=1 Tax=Colletotrichum costaricense TaxID=1209916 RepID=A0AAI9Z6U8_9PEZI|nr:uncharacterized protein CCOS01_01861 [Colletotrichum costaricense]KAK1536541.1 hypothetical protein CCOS01_01861 [Colletotrichum costaricense]
MLDYQPLGKRESSSSFLADHPVPVPTDNFPGLPTRLRYGGTTYIGLYSPAGSQSAFYHIWASSLRYPFLGSGGVSIGRSSLIERPYRVFDACYELRDFLIASCFSLSVSTVLSTTALNSSSGSVSCLRGKCYSERCDAAPFAFRRIYSTSAKRFLSIVVSADQFCAGNVATFPGQPALGIHLVQLPIRFDSRKPSGEAGRSLQAYRGKH